MSSGTAEFTASFVLSVFNAVTTLELSKKVIFKKLLCKYRVSSGVELIHAGSQSRQGRGASKRARSCGEKKSYKRKRRTAECRYRRNTTYIEKTIFLIKIYINLHAQNPSKPTRIHVKRRPCASESCRRLCARAERRASELSDIFHLRASVSWYSQPIAEAGLHSAHRRIHLPAFHRATSNLDELLRLLHCT
uniref:Uncharacterized protein n=1 Tax=Trichogramma kaykai TaxID=54128 RepID=A0ABD2WT62_9HYME